ncbi:uncharacterized protein HD556DRAFT_1309367 [Suillus plorans]|uniref:2OGFeDO JBP1/TET oxygenase domain-containing protein n=1 Tax=Suillus plorans TaxID=116603 RepID=A0A9P7AM41_9AGAM|nr:uncharacterized protein HD556DRAFT_1309367 [Suillus plorans]KAG1792292.1 hypothetical protein HD556DRAFT_1309367 [Suillus plorans]
MWQLELQLWLTDSQRLRICPVSRAIRFVHGSSQFSQAGVVVNRRGPAGVIVNRRDWWPRGIQKKYTLIHWARIDKSPYYTSERTYIISRMIQANGPWADGKNILDYDRWAGRDIILDGDGWAKVVGYYVDGCTKVDGWAEVVISYIILHRTFEKHRKMRGNFYLLNQCFLDVWWRKMGKCLQCEGVISYIILDGWAECECETDSEQSFDHSNNEEKEEKLLERCPPGHEGTKLVDIPTTILNVSGTIITWYLPDTLTAATQRKIWAATDLLTPDLEKVSEDVGLTPGCMKLSPAWFQQGHENLSDPEVSASLKGPFSEKILKAIARPTAITSAAFRVMHPEQYWAGLRAFAGLGEKAESKELPQMSETLQYWASVFNSLSIISNWQTPNHRDHLSIPECFDILTTVGNYSNAHISMPSLQLEFRYNPGCMVAFFSGRIVRHGVHEVEGDQVAWAWYMRDSVHICAGVPSCGWARVDCPP